MWNWLKNLFDYYHDERDQKNFMQYCRTLNRFYQEKDNTLIANFSINGYYYIFEKLVGLAEYEVTICCNGYDSLFNTGLLNLMNSKLYQGVKVTLINCSDDDCEKEKFIKCFEKENFKFYQVKNTENVNNFIVADCNKYWLEDTCTKRKTLTLPIKACACFYDYHKSGKLLDYADKLIIMSKEQTE